ncbi:MAG TPA: Hsp70 family protein, partial [Pseudonocardiaceae bacterium]
MDYWLGIDVGSTCISAAVCRAGLPPEPVTLGSGDAASVVVSSAVCVGAEGDVVVGEAAEARAEGDPDRVVRGFVGRVGDEVPMVVGGVPYSAAGVLALVVRWVVDRVAVGAGGPAAGVVVTYPVGWGAYKVGVVAQALAGVGLPGVRLCSEPVAAAVRHGAREKLSAGVVAVYDLGGASCDAAVIQKDRSGNFSVIGQPARLGHVGGVDFDDAVFGRVVNAVPEWGGLDAEDPGVLAAGVVLRRECRGAKEALSADTEVRIPVVG